ncbi:putative protein ImpA [Candidatus Burkholderia humilis]|nr:putative protein ImpA [Candidatus Burkholderia humilis]
MADQFIVFETSRAAESAHDCGANLECDAEFVDLQRAVAGTADQEYGDTFIPAIKPDWKSISERAGALLQRSKDLRITGWLTRAWTESMGLDDYAKGVALVADLLDTRWDGVYPRVETGDDSQADPFLHMNALQTFFSPDALAGHARTAALLHAGTANYSLRQVSALLNGSGTVEDGMTQQALSAALATRPGLRDTVGGLLANLQALRTIVSRRAGETWVPDMSAVEKPLLIVFSELSKVSQPEVASPAIEAETPRMRAPEIVREMPVFKALDIESESRHAPGEVRSRENASLLLERVCVYLESCEPAHPSSLLIRRAQRLLHMTFHEIIRDLAPKAIQSVDLLTGSGTAR